MGIRILIAVSVVLGLFPFTTEIATADHHYDKCDNVVDLEKGEKGGGPFFGLEYIMSFHFVAKHYCEADLPALRPVLENHITKNGCNKDTKIFIEIMENMDKFESASLSDFVRLGMNGETVTEDQARKLMGDMMDQELGGCDDLVKRIKTGIADIQK